MKTKKVLMLSQWYPLTMSRYFERAFLRREDIELKTIGPYTGANIPWKGGMTLPVKYAKSPTMCTFPNQPVLSWSHAKYMLGDWVPDLVLSVDAGIRFDVRPDIPAVVAHVATDPHVLNYDVARGYSDYFFNMQHAYMSPGDIYLPYAFDPSVHFQQEITKEYDCALIGMPYPVRIGLVNQLQSNGISVNFQNGPVFDEYREENCKAEIGLNWSSRNDMTARVFEIMAMGLFPVINKVTDLDKFFVDGVDYFGFSDLQDAISKISLAKATKPNQMSAYNKVWEINPASNYPNHSYDNRVYQILKECGL